MSKVKNLTGQKFGRLTIEDNFKTIKRKDGKGTRATWLCSCDCGKKVWALRDQLISGRKKSCGCIFEDYKKSYYGVARKNDLYATYKVHAKNRGLNFLLTVETFSRLTKNNCYFCDIAPYQVLSSKTNNGDYVYNGLDRLNNKKGYTNENCVAACGNCNKAKGSKTLEEFYQQITKIYKYKGLDESN